MKTIQSEFYGDISRWFVGVVEEAGNDEPKLGRVKVRIYGIHGGRDQVPIEDLPYASVLVPTTEPGISGLGRNPMLGEGATVFGIFMDGKNSQLPLVMGSIPTVQVPSLEQIEGESRQAAFNNTINRTTGTNFGGTAGSGTGGTAGIHSTLSSGLDGYTPDSNAKFGSNTQIAWEWLSRTGKYSPAVMAGLIGNFLAESGSGKPFDIQPGAKGDIGLKRASDLSIGIAQWYNGTPRQANLVAWANKKGLSEFDLIAQISFVDHELSTGVGRPVELKKKSTPTLAAIHVHRYYEIPAYVKPAAYSPIDGERMRLHEAKRVKYAKEVYALMTRKSKVETPPSPPKNKPVDASNNSGNP
jgi:hypothetical protein